MKEMGTSVSVVEGCFFVVHCLLAFEAKIASYDFQKPSEGLAEDSVRIKIARRLIRFDLQKLLPELLLTYSHHESIARLASGSLALLVISLDLTSFQYKGSLDCTDSQYYDQLFLEDIHDRALVSFGEAGIATALASAFEKNLNHTSTTLAICSALNTISSCSFNIPLLREARICSLIVEMLEMHSSEGSLVYQGLATMRKLCRDGQCREIFGEQHVDEVIVKLLTQYSSSEEIVRIACLSLSSLCISPGYDSLAWVADRSTLEISASTKVANNHRDSIDEDDSIHSDQSLTNDDSTLLKPSSTKTSSSQVVVQVLVKS